MSTRAASGSGFAGWLASRPPSAAIDITPRRVTAIAVAEQGGSRILSGHATVRVPDGAVEAALNAPNVHDAAALTAAIAAAVDQLPARPRRVALVLPDSVAKVSLIRFDKVPPRAQDLEQLIRWQVRKTAPFRIEDAQVSWVPAVSLADGGREYLVVIARRDLIESYENACAGAGVYAGIVDVASPNLINLAFAAQGGTATAGDWLLVHAAMEYVTLVVVRGADIVFFRNRTTADEVDLADLVHQTAMYHEDRLGGGGFSRIVLAGTSVRGTEAAERLRRQVEERTGTRPEALSFGTALALRDRITAGPELVDAVAAAAGLLLREHAVSSERVA